MKAEHSALNGAGHLPVHTISGETPNIFKVGAMSCTGLRNHKYIGRRAEATLVKIRSRGSDLPAFLKKEFMKLSPFQWAKINKEVHGMSDIIAAAYINQSLNVPSGWLLCDGSTIDDPDSDFGTADLSAPQLVLPTSELRGGLNKKFSENERWNEIFDCLRYMLGTDTAHPTFGGKNIVVVKTCTCGAQKTYGPTCSVSFHSSWCDLK